MEEKIIQFKGTIVRCVCDKNNFKVYAANVDQNEYPDVQINKYRNVSITGDLPDLVLDVEYEITAQEKQTKYGISYYVLNIRRDIPTTQEDVYEFLREILTENQATALIQTYPDIIDRVRKNRLDDIDFSKLRYINEKKFEEIKEKIISNFYLMDLVKEFKNVLSLSILKKIYKEYSSVDVLREKLKSEPYSTLTKISGIGFKIADSIIIKLQNDNIIDFGYDVKESPDRCYACILYLLKENESAGSTKMNIVDLRSKCLKLVPACIDHFTTVINANDIYYNKSTMDIALGWTYDKEKYIAENITKRVNENVEHWDFNIEQYRNVDNFELSDEQLNLLNKVCDNNVVILTAPAGSGKTSSTKALINMLRKNKKSYILVSPTGKAAKRLSECTGEEAKTIHRTLKYDGIRFAYNETNPLITDVVVVDEVGMVDVKLFYHLLTAITFHTRIVLIGDVFQLNSVGCGALLRDLLTSDQITQITFSKIFRMGFGGVLTACTYVRQNQKFIYDNVFTQIGEDKSYNFIPVSKSNMNNTIIALYTKLLSKYPASDVTVISAYNVGDNGCDMLNKLLQPIANPNVNNGSLYITVGKDKKQTKYYVGDIIIQCQNNYNAKLNNGIDTCTVVNGDQGEIIAIDGNYIVIKFDNCDVRYHKTEITDNIKHAFAISAHRMQGSQNKVIIFCCPSSHMYFLSNNIVYTVISRAEKLVYHLSDVKTLNAAMNKSDSNKRNTMLGDLLANNNIDK